MSAIENLLEIMARLRQDCPWDRRQSFRSVAPYTVEEAYEVADAIDREDWDGLRGELGDLLFQVVFHAHMAEEAGLFDFERVAEGIGDKLKRRHPHVFGTPAERARGPVPGSWERIKEDERGGNSSVLDGVAVALPALKRAQKLGSRAARVGFDWPDRRGVEAKIHEEFDELSDADDDAARHHELGDLLFAVVNLARHLRLDPEHALTDANRRFEQRFRLLEAGLVADGRQLADQDLATLEAGWQAAKRALSDPPEN